MSGRLVVDPYLAWRFHLKRCNCWHLVRAGWLELTGVDLGERTPAEISAETLTGRFDQDRLQFRAFDRPVEPSIALMRRPRAVPHVGLYHQRRVLQMTIEGPSYMPLATAILGWPSVEYLVP